MIHGILNVKKEADFTSHDVVAKLRGIIRQKKIGHTGTLDPDATGVLPVCLGKATKLCDLIGDWDKTYETVLLLGRETDTEDISGVTTAESEVTVKEEELRAIIHSFLGDYAQVPPMYSAKKLHGKKLYELARQGIVVEREPCPVRIKEITIKEIALPYVTMEVTCSKGTYIRSLCRDIGKKAGCGGCMAHLVRTRVADFRIEDAVTLSEIEALRDTGELLSHVLPVDHIFLDLPEAVARPEGAKRLYNGNPLEEALYACEESAKKIGQKFRVYDSERQFIGIYEFTKDRIMKPYKLFL